MTPTVVSFSGGRTSAYMLRKIWTPDMIVLFANTGKERPETLDFVRDVEEQWSIPIVWLEFCRVWDACGIYQVHSFKIISYETANRDGAPFQALLEFVSAMPNVVGRSCTAELKIRTMNRYLKSIGIDTFRSAIGIRADEAHRAIDIQANSPKRIECWFPLIEQNIAEADVMRFWSKQRFDLQLQSYEGNCDLCFLKAREKIDRIMRERPDLAQWWIDAERGFEARGVTGCGARFRADRDSYAGLFAQSKQQALMNFEDDEVPCGCTGGSFEGACDVEDA